jgi:PAS domain S-box-containing protein
LTVDAFGYTQTELLGQNIKMLMPEPFASNHDNYVGNFVKTGQPKVIGKGIRQVVAKRKDGELDPINLAVSEIIIAKKRYFVGVITQREEEMTAQKTLIENAREIVTNLGFPAIIINPQGTIQCFNSAAEKTLGYKLVEVVGRNVKMLMGADHAKKHDNYLKHFLDTNERRIIGKTRQVVAKHKDGNLIPVVLSVTVKEDMSTGNQIFIAMLIPLDTLKK